ncbi:hypothetical protein BN1232_05933 [Mycobacterium lentiflavum]|uniref:Uncharacterized protein n=1 Tax=Mycobacterium lentiflavum TaxID=141349 RepID=A0A0E3WE65_MYCLN|nr:hypothetical protein BN1232_05933 [Mycobacterium lentiflavum]
MTVNNADTLSYVVTAQPMKRRLESAARSPAKP